MLAMSLLRWKGLKQSPRAWCKRAEVTFGGCRNSSDPGTGKSSTLLLAIFYGNLATTCAELIDLFRKATVMDQQTQIANESSATLKILSVANTPLHAGPRR